MHPRTIALGLVTALTTACATDDLSGPGATPQAASADSRSLVRIGVMSRNLYIGTDLDVVVQALASPSPADNLPALLDAIGDLQATAWPVRVNAIADEIARERPHVVGLQEAWRIDINLTPLGLPVDIDLDFITSLAAALEARDLDYEIAVVGDAVSAAPMPGISVLDRDLILVDASRVTYTPMSAVAQTFAANVGVVAPGVNVRRGWVAVDAVVGGVPMRLVNTHLESGRSAAVTQLRVFQATQLMATLATAERVVLLGDFNDVPSSPMHGVVTGAGFVDAWAEMRPGVTGLTCCHVEVLSNARARDAFSQRIDYVFARGFAFRNGDLLGSIRLTGALPRDRIAGPLTTIWPSDHAGVAARLILPPSH
jgi:hypothetical protein